MSQLPDWWDRVDKIFAQKGVPTKVWTSIAFPESGFKPWAKNTNDPHGGSYGLFALNLGGQGKGYQIPYLLDPINNAMIAAGPIARAMYQCGSADNISCIAKYSGHPTEDGSAADSNQLIKNIRSFFGLAKTLHTGQEIFDAFTSGHGVPPDPGPGGGGILDPGAIGTAVGSGIASAFGSFFTKFFQGWDLGMINQYGPPAMTVSGLVLIIGGVFMAASETRVGSAAINAASAGLGAGAGAGVATRSAVAASESATVVRTVPPRVAQGVARAPGGPRAPGRRALT